MQSAAEGGRSLRGQIICDADEALRGVTAPCPYTPLQCTQVSRMVSVGIARSELDEKLERGLIRLRLQALNHLRPVVFEEIRASSARFVGQTAVVEVLDDDATDASIPPPSFHAPVERAVLPRREPPGELHAQLLEQLGGVDVRELLEAAAYHRPRLA